MKNTRREKKEMPIYVLVPAKNGLKVAEAKEGSCVAMPQGTSAPGQASAPYCGRIILLPNGIAGKAEDLLSARRYKRHVALRQRRARWI